MHELIDLVKSIEVDGRRLLVGTSFGGGATPSSKVIEHSDFLLIHGNGVTYFFKPFGDSGFANAFTQLGDTYFNSHRLYLPLFRQSRRRRHDSGF